MSGLPLGSLKAASCSGVVACSRRVAEVDGLPSTQTHRRQSTLAKRSVCPSLPTLHGRDGCLELRRRRAGRRSVTLPCSNSAWKRFTPLESSRVTFEPASNVALHSRMRSPTQAGPVPCGRGFDAAGAGSRSRPAL